MAKVVIFGAGVIAKMAHCYFTSDSEHEVVAFVVDRKYCEYSTYLGLPLIASEEVLKLYPPGKFRMFVAIGYSAMNSNRKAVYLQMKEFGYTFVNYVSSRCTFLTSDPIGDNCFILEDNTVQPFSKIGNNVFIWSGNHIGHDAVIEDHCFISSHVVIAGFAHLEPSCFLGVNATIRDGVRLGRETLVGAGASILQDTSPQSVYVSAQSKKLEKLSYQMKL